MSSQLLESEVTRLTKLAYEEAGALLGTTVVAPLLRAEAEDGTAIFLYVMGQSSVTGHGRQGMHPTKVEGLRRLDRARPVRLAFCEGRGKWACEWLRVLDAQGPADCVAQGDPADASTKRYGWLRRRMENGGALGPLELPESGPPAVESSRLFG